MIQQPDREFLLSLSINGNNYDTKPEKKIIFEKANNFRFNFGFESKVGKLA
jgi:hypothetical protein